MKTAAWTQLTVGVRNENADAVLHLFSSLVGWDGELVLRRSGVTFRCNVVSVDADDGPPALTVRTVAGRTVAGLRKIPFDRIASFIVESRPTTE